MSNAASASTQPKRRLHWTHWLLLAILLLGAILRFVWLEDQSLWYDEGFSIALAKSSAAQAIAWTAQDVHPPLYYLLLGVWIRLSGDSAFGVRAFSAWFGIATLSLVYVWGKRVLGQAAGLMAALLAALSPLGLYYSRETRMYTLATLLTLLSSYVLLHLTDAHCPREKRLRLWGVYLLLSLAAAYVHYFALLALVAHAIYFGAWWLTAGRPSAHLREAIAASLLWTTGYAPWYAVLINRYLYDTGYWAATMPFAIALRRVFTSLSVGESVPEPAASYVTIGYVVLLLIGVPRLFHAQRKGTAVRPLSFLWTYLLVPATLIAFLYSRKPRISPRHSMLLSPPFLLLITATIVQFMPAASRSVAGAPAPKEQVRTASALRPLLSLLAALLSACFVLAASGYADYNLLYNPNMRRPDFRAAVAYVREHCAPDEAIVLISGHMFPIFDYYCPNCERYPIPDDPLLRVDHMVTLKVIDQLQLIASGRHGVWLVLWQDNIVDPQHIVTDLLLRRGTELPVPAFRGVGVRHIQLSPEARFVWEASYKLPNTARWQHGITLLEARINKLVFRHGEDAQVTFFWQAQAPLKESYTVFAHIVQGEARTQHDGPPANGSRSTNTWRPGEVIEDRHLIGIPGWLPPGEYDVFVGLYNFSVPGIPRVPVLDEVGQEKGNIVLLGQVRVLPDGGQSP